MNLNNLNQLQQAAASKQVNRRHEDAQKQIDQGYDLYLSAQKQGFSNKELLKQAFSIFIRAIQLNRRNPESYLGAAMILTLVSDFKSANLYLDAVDDIDPDNESSRFLRKKIKELIKKQRETPKSSMPGRPKPEYVASQEEIDYDSLYDQVEEMIFSLVKVAMESLPSKPTEDPRMLKSFLKKHKHVKNVHQEILSHLEVVDEEIDIGELQQTMKPVEASLRRFELTVSLSKALGRLLMRLTEEIETVKSFADEAQKTEDPQDVPVLEENLEALLDNCDSIADELDGFDEKGVQANKTEEKYEKLVKEIEKLQDVVDDSIARLKQD